jgi:glycosyltransferase involved in cell wall biosynthesis
MALCIQSIAVIVPTRGDRDLSVLRQALDAQTRRADELLIIEDPTGRGSAWARNRGIEGCRAGLVAFIDDDCLPPPDWLETLAGAIERYDAAGAGGSYEEQDPFLRARRARQRYPDVEQVDDTGWVGAGGNVAYLRAQLEALRARDGHCFNEAFRISQDKELAWRIRARGGRLVYVPLRVRHAKRCHVWAYLREQFGRGIGIAGLHWAARRVPRSVPPDRGLLWAESSDSTVARWLRLLLRKVVGPFDRRSFDSGAHFALFWLGEKSQGLGFLWGALTRPFAARRAPS